MLLPDGEVQTSNSKFLNQSADGLRRKTEDPTDLSQGECGLGEFGGGPEVDCHDQALLLRRQDGPNLLDLGDDGRLDGLHGLLLRHSLGDVVDERVQFVS